MHLFSIISMLLTLVGLITFVLRAWRHYKLAFSDCFNLFFRELYIGSPANRDWSKHEEYVHGDKQWELSHTFSVKKYLEFTNQNHKNNSKHYADIFNKMQSHKAKVFCSILLKMSFADSIVIDGFEYDLHAFRLGK